MMMPPITNDEAEVADILNRLPELVYEESCNGELSLALHWRAKKRRTVPADKSAASSPTTPLFYSSSGAEGATKTVTNVAAPSASDPKVQQPASFKNAKQHKEWVKEQSQMIGTMSAYNINLERALSEAKRQHRTLIAKNSWLKEMRSKILLLQSQPQAQSGSLQVQLQWRNASVVSSETTTTEGSRVVPDLNASVEEEAVRLELGLGISMMQQQQRSAWKAAMSAQARKRRMEIKRVKGCNNAGSHAAFKQPHMRLDNAPVWW